MECEQDVKKYVQWLRTICILDDRPTSEIPASEWKDIVAMANLVGTQDEAIIQASWKEKIWKCPSCKYWFTIDWNHDNEVCCACAGCTKHPFLEKFVTCHCARCEGKQS